MEKIIYNTKLKKIVITTLIVMLVFNFIMPCVVNIVYAATYVENMFWPANGVTTIKPEEMEDSLKNSTDWKYEDYAKDLDTYLSIWYKNGEFDSQTVTLAVNKFNETLSKAKTDNKKLVEALRSSIDAAVVARKWFRG